MRKLAKECKVNFRFCQLSKELNRHNNVIGINANIRPKRVAKQPTDFLLIKQKQVYNATWLPNRKRRPHGELPNHPANNSNEACPAFGALRGISTSVSRSGRLIEKLSYAPNTCHPLIRPQEALHHAPRHRRSAFQFYSHCSLPGSCRLLIAPGTLLLRLLCSPAPSLFIGRRTKGRKTPVSWRSQLKSNNNGGRGNKKDLHEK